MKPKYEIGQEVYWADFRSHDRDYVTCPDCGGTGRLRVTFHDDTTVSIPCANCARGYEPPTGRIQVWTRTGKAEKGKISGMEIGQDKMEYRVQYWYMADDGHSHQTANIIKEEEVFLTEEEAQSQADKKAAEYDAEERAKIFTKEKDQRTWAWNASYHRKEIKDCERRLEYHRKKLAHAAIKAKEKTDVSA